ncbi:MAG: hypothetical protein CMJ76_10130 [Planctomycetaceae bacterium]|nr:hypothetical protein [Planctomycetaceae bacterium]|tara:strand:- start:5173 stop:5670 length:498 start_codon:yes stop_codon:yes gene_type:complete
MSVKGSKEKLQVRDEVATGSSAESTSALSQRPEFTTVCWQPRSQPLLFTGVSLVYAAVVFSVYWFSQGWAMAAVSLVALMLVSWRLWVPIRFHIGPTGLIQSVLGQQRQLGWGYVQQVLPHRGGLRVIYQTTADQYSLRKTIVICVAYNQQEDLKSTFEYYLQDR